MFGVRDVLQLLRTPLYTYIVFGFFNNVLFIEMLIHITVMHFILHSSLHCFIALSVFSVSFLLYISYKYLSLTPNSCSNVR